MSSSPLTATVVAPLLAIDVISSVSTRRSSFSYAENSSSRFSRMKSLKNLQKNIKKKKDFRLYFTRLIQRSMNKMNTIMRSKSDNSYRYIIYILYYVIKKQFSAENLYWEFFKAIFGQIENTSFYSILIKKSVIFKILVNESYFRELFLWALQF